MIKQDCFERFLQGELVDSYKYFGVHKCVKNGKTGYIFRLYAPMAKEVYLIGDFNSWKADTYSKMTKTDFRGLYEIFIGYCKPWQRYKFHLLGCDDRWKDKQDPYGFANGLRDESFSFIIDINDISIDDSDFIKNRDRNFDKPMSIYEFHMGTFKRRDDGSFYNYSELADVMIPYLKKMGYTHVEALPITSYPNDSSWGYQSTGYFAIDNRWGNVFDFADFVEKMHQNGIGVIMDFVPVHFALDSYGLERFDGSCLYEMVNDHEFSQWGTKNFDLGKDPVKSFLTSSLFYMAEVLHVDGFRFDAVSNMIYYDGDSSKGENEGAISFIKQINRDVHDLLPGVMMIAEDSSSFSNVTKGDSTTGLGFDYKWDLGWMNDTLKYYQKDPIYKKYSHNQITFSMAYFYSENFLLPFSHDEVVHMKGSMINKMWGSLENKFALLRNLYAYQFAHPGKKLNFMGNDLATFNEWKEFEPIDFDLLKDEKHSGINLLISDLNRIYREHTCMYSGEYDPRTFSWIMADNGDQSIYVFYRESETECMVYLFNMTPNFFWDYDIGVPYEGVYEEILNTDKSQYGGWGHYNSDPIKTFGNSGLHNQNYKITVKVPSFGAIYLCHKKTASDEKVKVLIKDRSKGTVEQIESLCLDCVDCQKR